MRPRAGPGRLALAILLALAVVPGLWWRAGGPYEPLLSGDLAIRSLLQRPIETADTGMRLVGAWQMSSRDSRFAGYSALVALPGGRLRAYSDHGDWLEFSPPGSGSAARPTFGTVREARSKAQNDVEAATYDRASGTTWLALENVNTIRRFGTDPAARAEVAPKAMAHFPANRGAEAMTRLRDGRFLVLGEAGSSLNRARHTGLLFARDPVAGGAAKRFTFSPPAGYDPSDAAELPDGRVLILLRAFSFGGFPPFTSRLVVADPSHIRAGQSWPWRPVATLSEFAPRENYEGLAVVPSGDGVTLWLISDSNDSAFLQRTLLLELHWPLRRPDGSAAQTVVPRGPAP